jgi:hypothetical protein
LRKVLARIMLYHRIDQRGILYRASTSYEAWKTLMIDINLLNHS